jgi:hypothetical protein
MYWIMHKNLLLVWCLCHVAVHEYISPLGSQGYIVTDVAYQGQIVASKKKMCCIFVIMIF